ncbi:transcriptional regulator [Paraburkholderia sp.]|uniref:transcriptional regulator n=1 Tax=Paraburkholderia sp. TaxID=1926495 RepID=UPI003D6F6060
MEQTERALAPYSILRNGTVPPGGWLRAIRESLGRSLRVQAGMLGITSATLHKSESAEVDGRISLAQLRKLAAGLDCEVVYALVPRKPLHEVVEERAEWIARSEVMGVAHTMSLEDQEPPGEFVKRKIFERRQALLSGPWSRLWR